MRNLLGILFLFIILLGSIFFFLVKFDVFFSFSMFYNSYFIKEIDVINLVGEIVFKCFEIYTFDKMFVFF